MSANTIHSTTILCVRHQGSLVMVSDGQVTISNTVMKHGANKLRRLGDGQVIVGFAGSAADSFSLFEKFDTKLGKHGGKLGRAAVELAKRVAHR